MSFFDILAIAAPLCNAVSSMFINELAGVVPLSPMARLQMLATSP